MKIFAGVKAVNVLRVKVMDRVFDLEFRFDALSSFMTRNTQ